MIPAIQTSHQPPSEKDHVTMLERRTAISEREEHPHGSCTGRHWTEVVSDPDDSGRDTRTDTRHGQKHCEVADAWPVLGDEDDISDDEDGHPEDDKGSSETHSVGEVCCSEGGNES